MTKWYTPTPADADLVDPPLDMTRHKTEHVCNLYNVNCRDPNCPCLRAPEGTCHMFLREGWCQRATHYAQNRMLPLKPGQPPLTDCDRPLHVVLHIDEGGMSWHPVAAYEKPLPSTGITPECADVIGGVKSKAKKQMSDGQEQMESGRFAARVPLLAMREVKGELAQDTLDGNQVSYRAMAAETRQHVQSHHDGNALLETGKRNAKAAAEALRKIRPEPRAPLFPRAPR